MDNHYHFVLHTRRANLSLLMRHVNGVYSQTYNRRHGVIGHLFQGRFKAILVDRDAYLLEVCRYVELNPVRARMVAEPGDWPWSSYRAHTGATQAPDWLDTPGLHAYLLGEPADSAPETRRAEQLYRELVDAGRDHALWDESLNRQIYLGNDDFVARMQGLADPVAKSRPDIPKPQRSLPRTLVDWLVDTPNQRELALRNAHVQSGISMTSIARELGLSVARVSQLIARAEKVVPCGPVASAPGVEADDGQLDLDV
jgi:hypothetical protein